MKLCCIFNYPPAYRTSIYKKIDEEFDTKFYFAEELEHGKPCDIKKLDYKIFKNSVGHIENRKFIKWGWKTGTQLLPYKNYDAFLITADADWSYIPFLIACKILRKPVYAWGHGSRYWYWKRLGTDWFFVKMLSGYFTYGNGGKKAMMKLGIPEKKLHVIYNSLCDEVKPEEHEDLITNVYYNHFNNDFQTILFIGRLTKVKQLDWILKCCSLHKNEGFDYNVIIIGDGPMMSELKIHSLELDLSERIWFYGECYDNNKLNELIYNADLCVSPGNVGLTALHSMMYGTPVLSNDDEATQMPEYEAIIPGQTGDLYRYKDFNDFCLKLKNWLNTSKDRSRVRHNCYNMINGKWNSLYQIRLLKNIIQTKI